MLSHIQSSQRGRHGSHDEIVAANQHSATFRSVHGHFCRYHPSTRCGQSAICHRLRSLPFPFSPFLAFLNPRNSQLISSKARDWRKNLCLLDVLAKLPHLFDARQLSPSHYPHHFCSSFTSIGSQPPAQRSSNIDPSQRFHASPGEGLSIAFDILNEVGNKPSP